MSAINKQQSSPYQLQGRGNRTNFGKFMNINFHGAPTYSQTLLMNAVGKALDAELTYTSDVFAFVVKELGDLLSNEVLSAGKDRSISTENGDFGMDIYYCRQTIETLLKRQANKAAMAHWNLVPGNKIKSFNYGTHKFATMTLLDTDDAEGTYTFECTKRGTKSRWTLSLPANEACFAAHMKKTELPHLKIRTENGITTAVYDPSKAYIAEQRFSA